MMKLKKNHQAEEDKMEQEMDMNQVEEEMILK